MTRLPNALIESAAHGIAARKAEARAKRHPMTEDETDARIEREQAAAERALQEEWEMTSKPNRGTLRKIIRALAVLSLIVMPGCAWFIPGAVQRQAKTEAALHEGHLGDWENLTPGQRWLVYRDSYDAWCVQDFNVNDTPLSAEVEKRVRLDAEAAESE